MVNKKIKKQKKEKILILCAHPDDEIIGMGGTIKRYSEENKTVEVVIFSGGEMSNALYEKEKLVKIRIKESREAAKIVGAKKVTNLNLNDMYLSKDTKERKIIRKIKKIILTSKPNKIFTHSVDDLVYKDHQAVAECVFDVVKDLNSKGHLFNLYTFNIWSINFRKRDSPRLIVDISDHFKTKLEAIKSFKSQNVAMLQLKPVIYIRNILAGWKKGVKYAEEFYKVI